MFTKQHFNAIAKDIRTELEPIITKREASRDNATDFVFYQGRIDALVNLALRFAKRFEDERPGLGTPSYKFDPLKFLDACSPNAELYPFSELWEVYSEKT